MVSKPAKEGALRFCSPDFVGNARKMIVGPLFFSLLTLLAVLVGSPVVSAQDSPGRFFNPADSGPASDFSEDAIWRVGETQTIKFTTTYSSYTIDLWQQDTQGGSASQGPSIFRKNEQGEKKTRVGRV